MSERPDERGGGAGQGSDPAVLWSGDNGTLREQSRRAVVALVRGPYLSSTRQAQLWSGLLADEQAIRSHLADMYLDLVVDVEAGVAFVRNVDDDEAGAPRVVRTAPLTFMDTAMLLHLRQVLVRESAGARAIVGEDEVAEQLSVYRSATTTDPAGFAKRVRASWRKLVDYGLLQATTTEDRWEISPVLRLVFGAEQVAAVQREYTRILAEPVSGAVDVEHGSTADEDEA